MLKPIRSIDFGKFVTFPELPGIWQICSVPHYKPTILGGDLCVINCYSEGLHQFLIVSDDKLVEEENLPLRRIPEGILEHLEFKKKENLILDWGEAI